MSNRIAIVASLVLLILSVSALARAHKPGELSKADSATCDRFFKMAKTYMSPPDLAKKPDYDSAAIFFEKCIACDSSRFPAYFFGAYCYRELKNNGRWGQLLLRVLELSPRYLEARASLAWYYRTVDSLQEASNQERLVLDQIKDDLAEEKETATLHVSCGMALLYLLDQRATAEENVLKIEDATRHFRRAVVLDPKNAQAHLWLGQALLMTRSESIGNPPAAQACREFKIALQLEPDNRDAKYSIQRVGCDSGANKR